ncbi:MULTISPECIES: hypothetical protein [unclassified Bartonella]|uniref:hypothetical protein n=1 Tax=unclassified Bartonella TaxID=2645622 RepID=UPI0035CEEE2B
MTGKVMALHTKINKNGSASINNKKNNGLLCETVAYRAIKDEKSTACIKSATAMKAIQEIIL